MKNRTSSSIDGRGALCALACAAAIVLAPGAGLAKGETSGAFKEGGLGMAAAISSLIYGPVKTVYALGGSCVAGFAWMFSGGDSHVAGTVLTRAMRGTYVITPDTLTGEREIEFVGRSPEYRADRTQVAVAAPEPEEIPDGW